MMALTLDEKMEFARAASHCLEHGPGSRVAAILLAVTRPGKERMALSKMLHPLATCARADALGLTMEDLTLSEEEQDEVYGAGWREELAAGCLPIMEAKYEREMTYRPWGGGL